MTQHYVYTINLDPGRNFTRSISRSLENFNRPIFDVFYTISVEVHRMSNHSLILIGHVVAGTVVKQPSFVLVVQIVVKVLGVGVVVLVVSVVSPARFFWGFFR